MSTDLEAAGAVEDALVDYVHMAVAWTDWVKTGVMVHVRCGRVVSDEKAFAHEDIFCIKSPLYARCPECLVAVMGSP